MLEKLLRDVIQNIEQQKKVHDEINTLRQEISVLKKDLIKSQTRSKWEAIDIWHEFRYSDCQISCRICDYKDHINNFKKLIAQCMFEGGKLERYECPQCGLIFGPLKFLLLDETSLANEYKHLYEIYAEPDTTDYEVRTFMALNPKKDGIYLNYGSGAWSNSIRILREQGWNIFGYEPYVSPNNSFTTNKEDAVASTKFDGIFSHNLIEHVQDPLQLFQFMKSLLRDNSCKMAHSTACYNYAAEHTRFHVHFFTGKSIDYLCDKVGLQITNKAHDKSTGYINYVYEIKNP